MTDVNCRAVYKYKSRRVPNITNLAAREADASPAPEDVVPRGALIHAGISVQKVPAGHAAAGVSRLRTASQALVVAALTLEATCTVLTVLNAH